MKVIITEQQFKKLIETSINDISSRKFISPQFIRQFIRQEPDSTEQIVDLYMMEYGLDDTDVDTDEYRAKLLKSPEFIDFLEDQLYSNLYDATTYIQNKLHSDGKFITIYREMSVDANWMEHLLSQGKHLGIYWTWDAKYTEAYWAKSKPSTAIITAVIKEEYINWYETLKMNLHPSYSEEREIRLYKNTPINITSIQFKINNDADFQEMDLSSIKNKTFYA